MIDAWNAGFLPVHISTALVYEYEDVLSRKLLAVRWRRLKPLLATLVAKAQFTTLYFSWRPSSPDAGDDLVIDCAMNAGATLITSNIRDFRNAQKSLGLKAITPEQLIIVLLSQGDPS
ncbi:PIN domain-containing protein [Acaryochloris thomasi]|uniref:PIN domain-containing protein n=1 Tax=Acaryochloris thomasi TaxID=2929456 RepID=UPI000DA6497B|nr:PIN domain-containing protein [Acaryochloris thomasi]